jgi:hypothetical protein
MKNHLISERTKNLFAMQGYFYFSSSILKNMIPGIKLPYFVHTLLILGALIFENVVALSILMAISAWGMMMPRHPLDYLYNSFVRKWINKPRLPKRPMQVRFGFLSTSLFSALAIGFLIEGLHVPAYAMGYTILFASSLMVILDVNIASVFYNLIRYGNIYPNEWKRMRLMMGNK